MNINRDKMELAIQYEVYEAINRMITKIEKKEKVNIYQRDYYHNNKEIFKKASKKYQQSEKGKKTIRRYYRSEKGKEIIKNQNKQWREKNPEKFKKIQDRAHHKKRQKILKRREEEDIIPSRVGGGGEIMLGSYKRRNWTKNEENILRECKRRSKSPYKASMTWKKIGILLNRPQKSIREKWRRMIEKEMDDEDEEIILLRPNVGIKICV